MITRSAVAAPALPGPLPALLPALLVGVLLTGCSEPAPTVPPDPVASAATAPLPGVELPEDLLRPLVPAPDEVPPGMVPLLSGSGARDLAAVADYSADPAVAAGSLEEHGFDRAYVAQYADPAGARVLSVVVSRFATAQGATDDLAGDLTASSGDLVELPTVGEASQARRQPLPGSDGGELVTLRFRQGATTWLLAYGDRPGADAQVAVDLARLLAGRAGPT